MLPHLTSEKEEHSLQMAEKLTTNQSKMKYIRWSIQSTVWLNIFQGITDMKKNTKHYLKNTHTHTLLRRWVRNLKYNMRSQINFIPPEPQNVVKPYQVQLKLSNNNKSTRGLSLTALHKTPIHICSKRSELTYEERESWKSQKAR